MEKNNYIAKGEVCWSNTVGVILRGVTQLVRL